MKNLGALLIQSLRDAVAFENGKLDARIKVGVLTAHEARNATSQRGAAWEDLWDCPHKRPYFCSHPHCLWCNWDREDSDYWKLAAYLGPTLPFERYYHPKYPEGHYIQDRRYIAWLCEECAKWPVLIRWFASRVRRYYPGVFIVQAPGSPEETAFEELAEPPSAPG